MLVFNIPSIQVPGIVEDVDQLREDQGHVYDEVDQGYSQSQPYCINAANTFSTENSYLRHADNSFTYTYAYGCAGQRGMVGSFNTIGCTTFESF